MVEVVGAAGRPRQMSWYLVRIMIMIMIMFMRMVMRMMTDLPSDEEHSLIQSSRSFSKEDWQSRRSFLSVKKNDHQGENDNNDNNG